MAAIGSLWVVVTRCYDVSSIAPCSFISAALEGAE